MQRSTPLFFLMARYKFVSKMLAGRDKVIEARCGDAAGTAIVLQTVSNVYAFDFEPLVLNDAKARYEQEGEARVRFAVHDICSGPISEQEFDAAYSLDVIEHVPEEEENLFMANVVSSLNENGVFILGTPNITAKQYASPNSEAVPVNLKSVETLHELMAGHFHNVFNFSMNDEVVRTGFAPMAHSLFFMGVGMKSRTQ